MYNCQNGSPDDLPIPAVNYELLSTSFNYSITTFGFRYRHSAHSGDCGLLIPIYILVWQLIILSAHLIEHLAEFVKWV